MKSTPISLLSAGRIAIALTFATAIAVPAQTMAGHDMSAMKSATKTVPPPSELPVPIPMTGIGNSHMKITASPAAQLWFNQGLTLMHDFWDYESARAFEQSIRVDPKCAMCYWGLSQSLQFGHNTGIDYSKQALDQAVALQSHTSKKEKLIIQATQLENSEDRGKLAGARDNKKASTTSELWQRAVDKDPKDPQTRIFLAESLMDGYTDAGEPKPGTQKAIDILTAVLKDYPGDSAANHYWIHAMEPSSHPERAIVSSQKLASLAPASGHMVHMPGHIFYRTGDYKSAEHWFAASTAVDEAYMHSQHVAVDDDWNYVHNLMYGIANLMEEGKLHEATELSGKLAGARGELSPTLYLGSPRDSMTRVNALLPIALRTADWQQVEALLSASKPDDKLENLVFLAGNLKQFSSGMISVEKGDLASAQLASNALDADLWRKTQALKDKPAPKPEPKPATPLTTATVPVLPDATAPPLLASLSIMSLELRASILAAQKNLPEAKTLFTQAAKEEKDLGYREPPMYIRPVGETEGWALLSAGDPDDAHTAYAAALADRPNSGFALYGMARSSEAAKHTDLAHTEYQQFLTAWHDSDPNSEEQTHAHAYLGTPATVAKN